MTDKKTQKKHIGNLHQASINRVQNNPVAGKDSRGQSFPASYPADPTKTKLKSEK